MQHALVADVGAELTLWVSDAEEDALYHPGSVGILPDMDGDGFAEIGMGAGWWEEEHTGHGFAFHDVAGRWERLEEQVAIVHGLLRDDRFSFEGRHYGLHDVEFLPKSVQTPHPPVLVAGAQEHLPFKNLNDDASTNWLKLGVAETMPIIRPPASTIGTWWISSAAMSAAAWATVPPAVAPSARGSGVGDTTRTGTHRPGRHASGRR